MDLALLIYGISVLSNLGITLVIVLMLSLIVFILSLLAWASEYGESKETAYKWVKGSIIAISIILPISVIVPSEKTMYTMVGAYAAQRISEDPKVQQLSAKVLKLVENKLDTYIDESTKKVTK